MATGQALRIIVAREPDDLDPHLPGWDALAVESGRPYCAPAWMLAWWHEARSGDARLRVMLALDGEDVVGVGPFFAQVGRFGLAEMRLLAAGFSHRIGLLCRPGREPLVATLFAAALAAGQPRPASIVFEGIDAEDRWPELLAAAWPSRRPPRLRTDLTMDAPVIDLGGDYEAWLQRRPSKFRTEVRRTARRLQEEDVRFLVRTDEQAIDALFELNRARWAGRGGSNVGDPARRTIARVAQDLGGTDRLLTTLLESPRGPRAADLVLSAGTAAAGWAGGFDPRMARHAPGIQSMLLSIRALAERGVQTLDMGGGGGEGSYKLKLADLNRPLAWRTLFPRGRRYPLIRLRLAPKQVFVALRPLARRLPPSQRRRLKQLVGRRGA